MGALTESRGVVDSTSEPAAAFLPSYDEGVGNVRRPLEERRQLGNMSEQIRISRISPEEGSAQLS